ncbi:hypothetical protein HYT53_05745 [Candidatus Woesearchaeota archaeon]|nr:hypothetical protein [Candidatus Woesearchaeota archaeon]
MKFIQFIKPGTLKILAFIFIGVLYLYFAVEDACAVGFLFAFCYKAHGFPFLYMVNGDIGNAVGHIKTLPLGAYFTETGSQLFNLPALLLDLAFAYLLACLLSMPFRNAGAGSDTFKKGQ